ncbi:MAG TPA: FmdB family zinc ribbon protein [Armatimonadota bacterium]|jgi:putative FmdB family regulatory protein
MPTYVYECRQCSDRFERMQKMSDPPVTACPECGGSVRKVMFPPAIAFKGSGFYVNDYKRPVPPPAAPACEAASTCSSGSCPAKKAAEAAA